MIDGLRGGEIKCDKDRVADEEAAVKQRENHSPCSVCLGQ